MKTDTPHIVKRQKLNESFYKNQKLMKQAELIFAYIGNNKLKNRGKHDVIEIDNQKNKDKQKNQKNKKNLLTTTKSVSTSVSIAAQRCAKKIKHMHNFLKSILN